MNRDSVGNPLISTSNLRRVVDAGRDAIIDFLMDWTPQGIARAPNDAFQDAMSGIKHAWLGEAIRVGGVVKDPTETLPAATEEERRQLTLRALEEAEIYFETCMQAEQEEILQAARSRLFGRATRVKIRVFRDRIDIVDVYQNKELYPYGQPQQVR